MSAIRDNSGGVTTAQTGVTGMDVSAVQIRLFQSGERLLYPLRKGFAQIPDNLRSDGVRTKAWNYGDVTDLGINSNPGEVNLQSFPIHGKAVLCDGMEHLADGPPDQAVNGKGKNPGGRSTKRTKAMEQAILQGIEAGLIFKTACNCVGVHYSTFNDWRKQDTRFALAIEQAEAKRIEMLLTRIEAAGHTDWKAWAWLLERRHPDLFARPDIQLQQHYVSGSMQIDIENMQAGVRELVIQASKAKELEHSQKHLFLSDEDCLS